MHNTFSDALYFLFLCLLLYRISARTFPDITVRILTWHQVLWMVGYSL